MDNFKALVGFYALNALNCLPSIKQCNKMQCNAMQGKFFLWLVVVEEFSLEVVPSG